MIYPIFFTFAGLVAQVSAQCSRDTLQEAAAAYVAAQVAGTPNISVLAANVTYLEDDAPADITKGVLSQPVTVDFNRSFYDTTQCATFTELIAASNKIPYVIHTRMLLTDNEVTTIDSFIGKAGDWEFNATASLYWAETEDWDPIPTAQQDTRATIQGAADAYLNQWYNASLPVPLDTPCARLEGGDYTGESNLTANTCTMGAFPVPINVTDRRYVIDETLGAVDVFDNFPWIEITQLNGTPSSNAIRVQGGLIRYIHELTLCESPNCGRTPPPATSS